MTLTLTSKKRSNEQTNISVHNLTSHKRLARCTNDSNRKTLLLWYGKQYQYDFSVKKDLRVTILQLYEVSKILKSQKLFREPIMFQNTATLQDDYKSFDCNQIHLYCKSFSILRPTVDMKKVSIYPWICIYKRKILSVYLIVDIGSLRCHWL